MLTVFENGNTRPSGNWSRIVVLDPPTDDDGNYLMDANGAFLPNSFEFEWNGSIDGTTFFSRYMSGVNIQPNGNFTVCEAGSGRFFELNPEGEMVWFYQNPDHGNITSQFNNPSSSADCYRAEKYPLSYPAFDGRELTQMGTVENLNPVSDTCIIRPEMVPEPMDTTTTIFEFTDSDWTVFPNPANDLFTIRSSNNSLRFQIFTSTGKLKYSGLPNQLSVSVKDWEPGIYFIRMEGSTTGFKKLVVQ